MSRRDLLRAAMAGAIVLPSERFVRRFFPVGIDLPRVWRPQSGEELLSMLSRARGNDEFHLEVDRSLTLPLDKWLVLARGGFGWQGHV